MLKIYDYEVGITVKEKKQMGYGRGAAKYYNNCRLGLTVFVL